MSSRKLTTRLLAMEARVALRRLDCGALKPDDWNRLTDAAAAIGRMPIHVDDAPALSLLELRALARRLQAELARPDSDGPHQRLGLVIIDDLEFMLRQETAGTRDQKLVELCRDLDALAGELGIPIVAVTRLSRNGVAADEWTEGD